MASDGRGGLLAMGRVRASALRSLLVATAALAGWMAGGIIGYRLGLVAQDPFGLLALAFLFVVPPQLAGCAALLCGLPVVMGSGGKGDGSGRGDGGIVSLPSAPVALAAFAAGAALSLALVSAVPVDGVARAMCAAAR